jgi:hypothetical protein
MPPNSVKASYTSLRQYLASIPDIGTAQGLQNVILEARNPFDSAASRSVKRRLILFSLVLVLGLGCFVYFNFWH